MIAIFHIHYQTTWGQKLFIVGSCPELGANDIAHAKEMAYVGDGWWMFETKIAASIKRINYYYMVKDERNVLRFEESERRHSASLEYGSNKRIALYDQWMQKSSKNIFPASVFNQNPFAREKEEVEENNPRKKTSGKLVIRLNAPNVALGQAVAITGNQHVLGNWEPAKALRLSAENYPEWEIRLNTDKIQFPLEYKFIAVDCETGKLRFWEDGENRTIKRSETINNQVTTVSTSPFRCPSMKWKTFGTVVPVFSLRSKKSFGIGDIGDLKLLIDWVKLTGQHVIQVLPMNDTTRLHTWADSYPYSAISFHAIHPIYVNLQQMGALNDKEKMRYYNQIQKRINSYEAIDYPLVEKYKTAYCLDFFKQENKRLDHDNSFWDFVNENNDWLLPYAAFCLFRDFFGTTDFLHWGEYAQYDQKKIWHFLRTNRHEINTLVFYFFLQYTLHTQFKATTDYAHANSIILKGDIPIGINRTSVDAWTHPQYFNMDGQTGAPPDDFSETGQNWSFPTYNWDKMEQDGYIWWKKRFVKMHDYFDAIRIDHILGFFRIWEIPTDHINGLCGHFKPALPLTQEQIESFGITFNKLWTQPKIHIDFLLEIFGEHIDALDEYLQHIDGKHLTMKNFCSTQKKIDEIFCDKNDNRSRSIKNGLMKLTDEVLFIQDPYQENSYHPRIAAHQTFAYKELDNNEKRAFDQLYHDFYFIRHNTFWKRHALKRLTPLVNYTDMLICGEDLGMLPQSVHEVTDELHILTLELERISKVYGQEFTDLSQIPYLSVCTTSTHDMPPIRCWWKEDRDRTQRYYNSVLKHNGEAPPECTAELAKEIIARHIHSAAMLTIIPLQDWFAIDNGIKRHDNGAERINIPSNPNHHWCYRMHISLEMLLKANKFNKHVVELLTTPSAH